jgi:hypothetical protein
VADRFGEFQKLGVGVIVVSMSRPESVARYLNEQVLPFPLLANPDRTAYTAFGLERTTWGRMLRPGTVWRFTRAVVRRPKIRLVAKDEDPLQTGGDFLIGADRRLVWSYTTPDPTDRPSVDSLLRICREHFSRETTP